MKNNIKLILFYTLAKRNSSQAFTLIELLVVVIIVGVLAITALPNFLSQTGKAREVEIKHAVGTINRAQQAFHFERQTFAQGANDQESINMLLGISFSNQYIDTYNIVANGTEATLAPTNIEAVDDGTRAYSGGVYFSGGSYESIICQSNAVTVGIVAPSGANNCGAAKELR